MKLEGEEMKKEKLNRFACIDVGGTAIKYGLLEEDGNILFKGEVPTGAEKGGSAIPDRVAELAAEIREKEPEIRGIAISSAGIVNSDEGKIVFASDAFPGYPGTNYKEILTEKFHLPVEVENDVNCAGLSEFDSGKGKGTKSMVMVTVGTGIGGCFIEEGRLLGGSSYSACEIGFLPIDGTIFQDAAASSVLVRDVAARKNEPVSEWNGRKIFMLADEGDEDCIRAIEKQADILGRGLGAISYILNPEVFVLGGGIMAREDRLRPLVERSFAASAFPLVADSTRIEFAAHQNDAGMKGALVNFLNRHPELRSAGGSQ